MGLKDKIKDALHGEKHDDGYSNTQTASHTTSGTHGVSGTHGTTGTHDISGTNTKPTSGTYGTTGTHDTPGTNMKPTSGTHGISDTHGTTGTYGTSGTHGISGTTGTTGTHTTPGSYPSDDYDTQTDTTFGGSTTTGTGRDYKDSSYQNTTISNDGHNKPYSTAGHRQTDSGVNFGDDRRDDKRGLNTNTSSQDPYWGSMDQGRRNSPPGVSHTTTDADERNRLHHKDLPLRPNEQPGTSSTLNSGRDDGLDRVPAAASGGTYNTVAGAGSPEFDSRGKHSLNAVGYQNQPSGIIRGSNQLGDDGYDSRIRDRDMGRDTRGTGAAPGLGAGAGLTGAGLAAGRGSDLSQRADADSHDMGLGRSDQYQPGGGVPQSSMLDPYQTGPNAGQINQGSNLGNRADPRFDSDRDGRNTQFGGAGAYNNSGFGTSTNMRAGQPHDSTLANKMDPRVDSDRDGSHMTGGRQGTHGMGPGHFGPGHDGAKVMHKCVGCGQDNDISQYFSKDAVYRMS